MVEAHRGKGREEHISPGRCAASHEDTFSEMGWSKRELFVVVMSLPPLRANLSPLSDSLSVGEGRRFTALSGWTRKQRQCKGIEAKKGSARRAGERTEIRVSTHGSSHRTDQDSPRNMRMLHVHQCWVGPIALIRLLK